VSLEVKEGKEAGKTNERDPDVVERRSSGDSGGAEGEAGSETDDRRETEVGGTDAGGEVGGGEHFDCEWGKGGEDVSSDAPVLFLRT
jgi:hypothetical protein